MWTKIIILATEGEGSNFVTDFIENIIKSMVDLIARLLPSTPPQYQISSFFAGFLSDNASFADYFLVQIFQGIIGLIIIAAIYKFIKILPLI